MIRDALTSSTTCNMGTCCKAFFSCLNSHQMELALNPMDGITIREQVNFIQQHTSPLPKINSNCN